MIMQELFANVLEASLSGSVVILAVIVLRFVLKKAPRSVFCLLWLLAGLRLVLPFEIESSFSLQPEFEMVQREETPQPEYEPPAQLPVETIGAVPDGNTNINTNENTGLNPGDGNMDVPVTMPGVDQPSLTTPPAEPEPVDYKTAAAWIWAAGIAVLWGTCLASYTKLKWDVREAWLTQDGCWECPGIETAFVLGFMPPKIYLPTSLTPEERKFIFDHENTHIARHDHWRKLLGYLVLSIHWFNPLVWVGYSLLCRDIELACDEHVVKYMDLQQRKAYSAALLSCSSQHRTIAVCPVAFGESNPKKRILNVLNYKRPTFWISLLAVVAVIFVVVCLMTSPGAKAPDLSFLNYENSISLVADRETVIAIYYRSDTSGGHLSICKADGSPLAAYLDTANWQDWLVSGSHNGFTAYIDFLIDEDYSLRIFDDGHADVCYGDEIRHYRIPKADYEQLKALLSDANEEDVRAASAEYVLNWGLTLTAEHVSPTGMDLICTQDGTVVSGELMTGRPYWLEQWTGTEWVTVPTLAENTVWTTEGLLIPIGKTVRWDVEWGYLYGELPEGTYRLGKTISLRNAPGDDMDATYYAQFEIGVSDTVTLETMEEYMAMCEAAVAGLRSRMQYHMTETLSHYQNDRLASRSDVEFWYDEANWIRQSYVENISSTRTHLYYDGYLYYRIQADGSEPTWDRIDAPNNAEYAVPWLCDIAWDEQVVTFEGAVNDGESLYITVTIHSTPTMLQWEDVTEYTVHFAFDMEGNLYGADMTCQSDSTTVVSAIRIQDTSEALIRDKIQSTAAQRPPEVCVGLPLTEEGYLEKCRAALEEFQSQNSWCLLIDRQFSGRDALNDNSTQLCYGSGDDWMRQGLSSGADQNREDWYLMKDGSEYSRIIHTIHDPANGESSDTGWVEDFPNGGGEIREPWPVRYEWDAQNITFVEHTTEDSSDLITLTIQGDPNESDLTDVTEYQVTFWFRASGELWKITKQYTETWPMGSSDGTKSLGVIHVDATITLENYSDEEIAQLIDQKYQEAIGEQ